MILSEIHGFITHKTLLFMKNTIFWDVIIYSPLDIHRRFGVTYYFGSFSSLQLNQVLYARFTLLAGYFLFTEEEPKQYVRPKRR
jgi:hypothetical protein